MKLILSIAIGGAIGAVGRHFLSGSLMHWLGPGFPWGTLGVNALGSLCLGLLAGTMTEIWSPSPELRALLVVGVLGAFTTFSAFALDAVLLIERSGWALAALYCAASVILAVGGLFAGMRTAMALLG